MAADEKSADFIQRKRPTSAPTSTPNVMTSSNIPVIVLDDSRKEDDANPSSSTLSSTKSAQITSTSSTTSATTSSSHPLSSSSQTTSSSTSSPSHKTQKHTSNNSTLPSSPRHNNSKTGGGAGSSFNTSDGRNDTSQTPTISIQRPKPQISIRSSSDISIPAASMPNLALQSVTGEGSAEVGGENYLGVYCSPRTTRRSVDLDIKHTTPGGQYEWIESVESSVNSLKVLTSSSRVGSALSLNSDCTTRSIGLLSNDSDSEEFSQSDRPQESGKSSGQGQLRRYMSYPEEGQIPESSARPSQSLSNLKSANFNNSSLSQDRYLQRQSLDYSEIPEHTSTTLLHNDISLGRRSENNRDNGSSSNISKEGRLGHENNDSERRDSLSGSCVTVESSAASGENNKSEQQTQKCAGMVASSGVTSSATHSAPKAPMSKRVIGSVRTANNNNMLCYKCDTNSPSREGRIRQWLQDMDTTQTELLD